MEGEGQDEKRQDYNELLRRLSIMCEEDKTTGSPVAQAILRAEKSLQKVRR